MITRRIALPAAGLLAATALAMNQGGPAVAAASSLPPTFEVTVKDATTDGAASGGLGTLTLDVDPNSHDGTISVQDEEKPGKVLVIVALGTLSGTTCTTSLEIVMGNSKPGYVVRPAGSTTVPPDNSSTVSTQFDLDLDDPQLAGITPNCAGATMTDRSGTVLDTATAKLTRTPVPQITVETFFDPVYQLPASTPTTIPVSVDNAAKDAEGHDTLYGATLALSGTGITSAPVDLPFTTSYDSDDEVEVDQAMPKLTPSPGIHQVTATVTGKNVNTYTSPAFTVYAPGGTPPAATGDLTGRRFAAYRSAISFLDRHLAYVGIPPHGTPRCTQQQASANQAFTGCHQYWWDTSSNLLQVGQWIGAPDLAPTGTRDVRGAFDYDTLYCQDWGYPKAGSRFKGSFLLQLGSYYQDEFYTDYEIGLTLTKAGRFTLAVDGGGFLDRPTRAHTEYHHHYAGRYTIAADGVLKLAVTGRHGRHVAGTLGVAVNGAGQARPQQGLVLNLSSLDPHAVGVVRGDTNGIDYSIDYTATAGPSEWTPERFTTRLGCRS